MIFIVYDISDRNSFKNITVWINFIKSVNKDSSILVLVGNKTDLKREIQQKEAKELASKENMIFYEVSAKNGDNIENMFYSCIIELPYFSQLDIEDKQKFVQDLIKFNKNRNSSTLLEDIGQTDAKSNIGLKQQNGKNKKNLEDNIIIEEKKRICHC
jgi:GTPase SAR1 family protein